MAVVKNPFLSTDARGSLFGLTASAVRGGNVVKKKARPSTKYEPRTCRARSIMGWLSRNWGGLEDEERDSWDAWAIDHPGTDKFGDPFIMSGFNAYVMLNHHAVRFGGGVAMNVLPPEDPPPSSVFGLTAISGEGDAGDIDLLWTETGTGIEDDYWEIQIAGPFQSKGRKSVESRFQWVAQQPGDELDQTVKGLDEGMWYWLRVRYVAADGQKTAWAVEQATPKLTV